MVIEKDELKERVPIWKRELNEKILNFARSLYYPERDYERVLSVAEGEVERAVLEQLKKFLIEERSDLKREDAVAALKRIRQIMEKVSYKRW